MLDEDVVQLGRQKAMALLAHLAVTRLPHRREGLAALLWPESGPSEAFAALRNALWILHRSPVGEGLTATRSTIGLDDRSVRVDVNRFRELARGCGTHVERLSGTCHRCETKLKESVEFVRGPFMSGFSLPDSAAFDDWQIAEREALGRELGEVLSRLVLEYREREERDVAAVYARRWVAEDPLNEEACRQLMFVLAEQGQRPRALEVFERCATRLADELGIEPEAATAQVAERIRKQRTGPKSIKRTLISPNNLPASLLRFVGRREELRHLHDLLTVDAPCLVTLVGIGGSGKTRLALEAAHEALVDFPGGVFFVPLDEGATAAGVTSAMAAAVGLRSPRDETTALRTRLIERLRAKRTLVVLDAVEDLAEDAACLTDLLESMPRLHILATSREPLGLASESLVPLHGLAYPSAGAPRDALADSEALQLLRVVARRIDPTHSPNEAELFSMARIAQLLDGLPLGLELAATWTRVLSWETIAARIASDPDFLTSAERGVPSRHRSLRAIFDQTQAMLSSDEQRALRGLSIFREGFTARAAEEVVDCPPSLLASMVNRCLIRRVTPERYRFHELLRQFAHEHLRADTAELDALRVRAADYYLNLVRMRFAEMQGPRQRDALFSLRNDIANIRSAVECAAQQGDIAMLRGALAGLFFFYDMWTDFEGGGETFGVVREALSQVGKADATVVRGFVHVACGWFLHYEHRDRADRMIRTGLTLLEGEDRSEKCALAVVIAAFAGGLGTGQECCERLRESLRFFEETGDRWSEALALEALSGSLICSDHAQAVALADRSLRIRRELGDCWGEALVLFELAQLSEAEEKLAQADLRYHESQRLFEFIADDLYGVIDCLIGRARTARKREELKRAAELSAEALSLAHRAGSVWRIARVLVEAGLVLWAQGDPDEGLERLKDAFGLHCSRGDTHQAACAAGWIGDLLVSIGETGEAEGWYHEALSLNPEDEHAREGIDRLSA